MNRTDYEKEILGLSSPNLLLELPTGFGKSSLALKLLDKWGSSKTLIVVPKLVLIPNWQAEIRKWGYKGEPVFTTYASIEKHVGQWDAVVYDECHHFTDRVMAAQSKMRCRHFLGLSATMSKEAKLRVKHAVGGVKEYAVSARKAMDDMILPDPQVLVVKMELSGAPDVIETKYKGARGFVRVTWAERKKYMYKRDKTYNLRISCTEAQHYEYLQEKVDYWKRRYGQTGSRGVKNIWLQAALERNKWLSTRKEGFAKAWLAKHKDDRALVFCSDIGQTERVCPHCVNSKEKSAREWLEAFNAKKINHISACSMLNEGVNLSECQYGLFLYLSSSNIVVQQRNGRLLRHKDPKFVIPYFQGTREQEIVFGMLKLYNPELVKAANPEF